MDLPTEINKLLIVDDNPNNLFSFEAVLKTPELEIITAESGEQALQTLLAQQNISLILMDVQMPGMDGFETAELIRGQRKFQELPILFISAVYQSDEAAKRGFEVGAFDYITKPVNSSVLKSKVNIFLTLDRQKKQLAQTNTALSSEVAERKRAEAALQKSHNQLEILVDERTAKLAQSKTELQAEITERKKVAAELKRSNEDLEQFAYVASHDLQEPLTIVINYLQLLQRRYQGQLDSKADEFIDFATDAASRMKALIGDLLAYAHVGSQGEVFKTTACDVVLNWAIANLQVAIEESDAKITHDALPSVMGDAVQLTQLFQNLIGNALKFRAEQLPIVHVGANQENGAWLFSVQDNGIGLDLQFAERIFTIFQRLHTQEEYSGTGIGLAVTKKIIERHGGRIWVESEVGKGTTFYFELLVLAEQNNGAYD